MYTDKVKEYFENPINEGEILDADVVGEVINEQCCDLIRFYITCKNNLIENIKFESNGCPPAVASACAVTILLKNKTIDQANNITYKDILQELGGLPEEKVHCAVLAERALKNTLKKKNQ